MNANAFRHYYNYHFSENRKIREYYIQSLTQEQFLRQMNYSHGSVRDQIAHLIDVDEIWFCELQGIEPAPPDQKPSDDRERLWARWDQVEQMMGGYLDKLEDHVLFDQPITEPEEDQPLFVWQVLLHVINHGTDHRAQLLRFLNDLGIKTEAQDYIFYAYENPLG